MNKISLAVLLFFTALFFCPNAAAQLYMSNGDSLYISPGEQLYIDGNLDVQQGATIINHSAVGIHLTGSAGIQGEIDYSASANQHILPYHHKTLHIGGTGNKLLTADIAISDQLQLGGTAKLVTGHYLITLSTVASSISGTHVFGSNANSWIVTGNGSAGSSNTGLGGLKIAGIGSTGRNGNVLFPVGPTIFKYHPLTLKNTGTTDDYTVSVNDQVVPGADSTKSIHASWNISEATIGGSNVELGTQWGAAEEAVNFMRLACGIVHSNGTFIDYHAAVDAAGGLDPFTRTGAGFSNFSSVGVTCDGVVLPVSFLRLVAYLQQETVQVEWEVTAETGISYYEVQKSNGNNYFVTIGSMAASAGNNNLVAYQWIDRMPDIGANFYRIRSIGINGAVKYSGIAKVHYAAKPASITAYPNPVINNKLTLDFKNKTSGVYTISILSTTGALVYQTKMRHQGGTNKYGLALPTTLARELYQMNIDGPDGSRSQLKIMIHQ
jgi:hypothetical protein